MPKTIQGHPINIEIGLVGILTREHVPFNRRAKHIFLGSASNARSGYRAFITTDNERLGVFGGRRKPRIIATDANASDLHQGDVLQVNPDGSVVVIWGAKAKRGNALFITPACNCRCIMCPQPPTKHSQEQTAINKEILGLLGNEVTEICLTGGEPTLPKDEFLDMLATCTRRFPRVPLTILSNGLLLADIENTKDIVRIRSDLITFCVPLYSDVDDIHDEITGLRNSFYRTIKGIHNLALVGIPVEIRHVIIRRNCDRLTNFAEFVYRNFPFAVHVAYMGCEMTGLARTNADRVWVDPSEYSERLESATYCLEQRGMKVSVYNHQLCLLSGAARRNARQAISDWKTVYLPRCSPCKLRNDCGGFFGTSDDFFSEKIAPVIDPKMN